MSNAADEPELNLGSQEKEYLLNVARNSIYELLGLKPAKIVRPESENLDRPLGVFVTLQKGQELRGCIGYVIGVTPLEEAVKEMAKAAASNDPRFPPVTSEEAKELEIEISVLSPLKTITNIDEIKIGTHGLMIQRGYQRGLLLPQVATRWKWDREQFLKQTCIKAGLPPDAWEDPDTRIQAFSAVIFSESEILQKD